MAVNAGRGHRGGLSPEGVLREVQVTLMECKVCFEKFCSEQKERRPQNLSCGHVLCLECITALSHPLLRKLECPFCRQLCSVDGTSHCQVLCDLQELLLSWRPSHCRAKEGLRSSAGPTSSSLHLHTAFGGWGTLINPTGIAALGSSGTLVVVHDGEERVAVFDQQGRKLNCFGRRGQASGQICYPVDVAVTPCGFVAVTDAGDKAVKIFTSRGNHVLSVKDVFQMPWGVSTDGCGHLLVTDVQAGTLSHVKVDYSRRVTLQHRAAVSELQQPRAVSCCALTGNTAVVEHLTSDAHPPEKHRNTRLKVFSRDFHLLYQTDSFSLSLQTTARLNMSALAFDADGDILVTDSERGMVWSLGRSQNGPVLTPLVADHLIRPVGLMLQNNMLTVLDCGDHAVRIYSAKPEAGSKL